MKKLLRAAQQDRKGESDPMFQEKALRRFQWFIYVTYNKQTKNGFKYFKSVNKVISYFSRSFWCLLLPYIYIITKRKHALKFERVSHLKMKMKKVFYKVNEIGTNVKGLNLGLKGHWFKFFTILY